SDRPLRSARRRPRATRRRGAVSRLRGGHGGSGDGAAGVGGNLMAERVNARILGLGRHLPHRGVTNDDLAARIDTSDAWIPQRTGIRERRHIGADAGPADLGAPAAREALKNAGVRAEDLDLILLGTLSPDIDFPSSAALLQRQLGVRGMPAMDVRNQCSGFLY